MLEATHNVNESDCVVGCAVLKTPLAENLRAAISSILISRKEFRGRGDANWITEDGSKQQYGLTVSLSHPGCLFMLSACSNVLTAVLPWRLMLGVLCMYRAVPNLDFGLRFRPTMKQGLCRSCGCEMGVANACREDVRSQALKSIAVCS